MIFVLTSAGSAAVALSAPAPVVFTNWKAADGFGYVPTVGQTALVGAVVATGVPSDAVTIDNNNVRYTVSMDADVGPFLFGEMGLYLPGDVLGAVGVSSALITKSVTSVSGLGNSVAVDAYLTTVGTNYSIYAELGNSNYPMNLQAVPGVDSLPRAAQAFPNIFMATAPDLSGSTIAWSNNSLWSIVGYEERVASSSVASSTGLSVNSLLPITGPAYPGELILQFDSGANLGVCRVISGYNPTGNVISFASSLTGLPDVGDTFRILRKTVLQPHVATILSGLSMSLTAGMINALVTNPLTGFLKTDGSTPMLASLDAGTQRVVNLGSPLFPSDAVNKSYVDSSDNLLSASLNALSSSLAGVVSTYFRKDGSTALIGNLNAGGFRLINVGAPSAGTDAATRNYVDTLLASISGSIVTLHNSLSGVQGGSAGNRFHLTAAEHTFLSALALSGFPSASYAASGITQYATATEVGIGFTSSKSVTPDSLLGAISAITSNPLQVAINSLVAAAGSMQFGAGSPTVGTPPTPNLYVDTTTTPRSLWVRQGGTWYALNPITTTVQAGLARTATQPEVDAAVSTNLMVSPATLRTYVETSPTALGVTPAQFTGIAARDVVRYNSGNFAKAQATGLSPSNLAVGFADVANSRLVRSGILSGFSGLTVDSEYYLSASTAGAITTTAPIDAIRVGIARSATELYIDIDPKGGSGTATGLSLTKSINQAAHGFVVGDSLYFDGINYVKGLADADATSDIIGLVSVVSSSGVFVLLTGGYISGMSGLTPGSSMRLSTSILGALQATPPSAIGHVDKPILIADSTTSGWVNIMRGSTVVSTAPTGAAGGDLLGFYPNPTVVASSTVQAGKIQLATAAEMFAAADTTKSITPALLGSRSAVRSLGASGIPLGAPTSSLPQTLVLNSDDELFEWSGTGWLLIATTFRAVYSGNVFGSVGADIIVSLNVLPRAGYINCSLTTEFLVPTANTAKIRTVTISINGTPVSMANGIHPDTVSFFLQAHLTELQVSPGDVLSAYVNTTDGIPSGINWKFAYGYHS